MHTVAVDEETGRELWKAKLGDINGGVLIGSRFRQRYASDSGADLRVTWPGETSKLGGGTVWGWISYDPDLDLLYYGTSNPGPWNPAQRPGDNKWTMDHRPTSGGLADRDVEARCNGE